jgi:hypothetical protein
MRYGAGVAAVLVAASTGADRAVAQDPATATTPLERLDKAAEAMRGIPRLKSMTHDRRKALVEFVTGNTLFVLVHELGHAVISEMRLPVLGREEDAADAFGAVVALEMKTHFSERVLIEAAKGWFLSDRRNKKEGNAMEFYDAHGLDLQRAYNIVCLIVGSDPKRFKVLADETKLPEDRQETCQGDYSNASWSWDTILKPHLRQPDQPKTAITVHYSEPTEKHLPMFESFKNMRMLEALAERSSDRLVWPKPFTMEARSCDEPNAHWDGPNRTLFFCYELAMDFARLYMDYGDRPKPAKAAKAKRRR